MERVYLGHPSEFSDNCSISCFFNNQIGKDLLGRDVHNAKHRLIASGRG